MEDCKHRRQSPRRHKLWPIDPWSPLLSIALLMSSTSAYKAKGDTSLPETGCRFPDFLWHLPRNVSHRTWHYEIRYTRNTGIWYSRYEVEAFATRMTVTFQHPGVCADATGVKKRCINSDMPVTYNCVSEEGNGKYRLKRINGGDERFTCFRFIYRNRNVIQTWTARPTENNGHDLCGDDVLKRYDWPWIAVIPLELSPCPLVGGFDFRAYLNEKKKMLCHRIWRPSRVESECVTGEGIQISFPERSCSFLKDRILEGWFQCLAHWTEGWHEFVVATSDGGTIQYVLRLPYVANHTDMTSHLYFSAVCPLGESGTPSGQVMHVEMRMHQSESGTCYDESDDCQSHAANGRCRNTDLHHYGNHCKRTCGLCQLVPSVNAECDFPLAYKGTWLLFGHNRKETVRVSYGRFSFSTLGNFVCKSKHWENEHYKFLSVYTNGCRPRYTCMDMNHDSKNGFLKFRISKSSLIDRSFDICKFDSDPYPLTWNNNYKILYPVTQAQQHSCGLGGLLHTQVTLADGLSCRATLSDWNPFKCQITPKMSLQFRSCMDGNTHVHREFTCEAYIRMGKESSILVTREEGVELGMPTYACWIIDTERGNHSSLPRWRQAYILRRPECGYEGDMDPDIYKPADTTFQMYTDPLATACSTEHTSTTKYSLGSDSSHSFKKNQTTANAQTYNTACLVKQRQTYLWSFLLIFYIASTVFTNCR